MKLAIPAVIPDVDELGHVHFIGIGGAGLSGMARILLQRGMSVSGSDAADSATLAELAQLGARCFVGHAPDQVEGADTVVVSTAVPATNPELIRAQELGLRLLPRSAALQSIMAADQVVAVAGTHGKTTTSSMIATILRHAGRDPSFAIGAVLTELGVNARHGSEPWFIAEADESDGAFLVYRPYLAIVTNVEPDHLDNYGTADAYHAAFEEFVDRIRPGGVLVVCVDDPGGAELARYGVAQGYEVVSVGETHTAQYQLTQLRLTGARSHFQLQPAGAAPISVELQVPGRHYCLDAALAMVAAEQVGLTLQQAAAGVAQFRGNQRRMEYKGSTAGVTVYDSYAHHPREITADLEAARALATAENPPGRVLVVFQPHLVSRTRIFGAQMGQALGAADFVAVLDIFLAREAADPAVSGALVADAIPLPAERRLYAGEADTGIAAVVQHAERGDVILTLGAGDVTHLGPQILARLAARGRRSGEGNGRGKNG